MYEDKVLGATICLYIQLYGFMTSRPKNSFFTSTQGAEPSRFC